MILKRGIGIVLIAFGVGCFLMTGGSWSIEADLILMGLATVTGYTGFTLCEP